jgi:hypothetical protein
VVLWDSLGFSGSLCEGATAAADLELLTFAPPSATLFSPSFTLLGLHTTSETTPSVFFSKDAAWKTKLTICDSRLFAVSRVDRQQDGSGLPSHSLTPGACPCSQLESYLLQWGLPATQVFLIINITMYTVFLISNFHGVLNVICFLLGDSQASVVCRTYSPTKMEQSVVKRCHFNYRHWQITHKKAYNMQSGNLEVRCRRYHSMKLEITVAVIRVFWDVTWHTVINRHLST